MPDTHYRPNPQRTSLQSYEGPSADWSMDADFRDNPLSPSRVDHDPPSPGGACFVVTGLVSKCGWSFQLPILIRADQSISNRISIHGTWKVPLPAKPVTTMRDPPMTRADSSARDQIPTLREVQVLLPQAERRGAEESSRSPCSQSPCSAAVPEMPEQQVSGMTVQRSVSTQV